MMTRRRTEGFNLAFLDIMSCGLGAVILVFMLVKYQTHDSSIELERLEDDIQALQSIKQNLLNTVETIERQISEHSGQKTQNKQKIATLQKMLDSQRAATEKIAETLEKLKSNIQDIYITKPVSVIENQQTNEENYLLGLQIQGEKIAILIDSSASMTDEKLIDIIKTKNSPTQEKQQAEKWNRVRRIVEWLLARLPKDSSVVAVIFNENTQQLGGAGWQKASDSSALSAILDDLSKQIPMGGTNLHIGLKKVYEYAPSNLYLITDGLPTKGESRYKQLNPFSSCGSLIGRAQTISGECRVKLFQQTINETAKPGTQVDIILLPIEGDPDAINQYWIWAASSGGLVLSPASNWP